MDIVPLYPAFMTPYIQPLIKFTGEPFCCLALKVNARCTPINPIVLTYHGAVISVTRLCCMKYRNPNQKSTMSRPTGILS
jgi:hypothetical protein